MPKMAFNFYEMDPWTCTIRREGGGGIEFITKTSSQLNYIV